MNKDAKFLFSLLDDDDDQTAANAMVELLRDEQGLEEFLRDAQDDENPLVRRRIHQMQGILYTRRFRRSLGRYIRSESPDLIQGLVSLHFQWFDNDPKDAGLKAWKKLLRHSRTFEMNNISGLGEFMFREGYRALEDPFPEAEDFCIGEVLDTKEGSDALLCAIAQGLGKNKNIETRIVTVNGQFGLMESPNQILMPTAGWTLRPALGAGEIRSWTPGELLKYAAVRLFTCAVVSDNFRYVGSLAVCLGQDNLSLLPYPFGARKD